MLMSTHIPMPTSIHMGTARTRMRILIRTATTILMNTRTNIPTSKTLQPMTMSTPGNMAPMTMTIRATRLSGTIILTDVFPSRR